MKKFFIVLTAAALALSAPIHAQQKKAGKSAAKGADSAKSASDAQPKFIWGILIKFIASEAFSAFEEWMATKISEQVGGALADTPLSGGSEAAGTIAASAARMAVQLLLKKGDTKGGAFISRSPDTPAGLKNPPLVTVSAPTAPVVVDKGTPNYQGMHIAIVGADRQGNLTELRPVKAGFRTGERFKVRAMSTFAGPLVIENINPNGERRQIYPPDPGSVVMLQAGADTLLPLDANQFFEFAKTTGDEQLVLTIRDPRAKGDAASREPVHRKDQDYGSDFLQEVGKDTFPVISQAIHLQHN